MQVAGALVAGAVPRGVAMSRLMFFLGGAATEGMGKACKLLTHTFTAAAIIYQAVHMTSHIMALFYALTANLKTSFSSPAQIKI
eukprot:scaffold48653_cov23-Prasinocladus_malaysianus.AAC.1